MCKNTFVECVDSPIKKNLVNSSNSDLNLEQWRVKVKSSRKKVKRLKSRNIF